MVTLEMVSAPTVPAVPTRAGVEQLSNTVLVLHPVGVFNRVHLWELVAMVCAGMVSVPMVLVVPSLDGAG